MGEVGQRGGADLAPSVGLRTLVRDTSLGLEVIGRSDITDRRVTWVYISELSFPGPWLDGGELVATMGQWLRGGQVTADEYVSNIVAAGAGALVFSSGPSTPGLVIFPEVPSEVIRAADTYGLPLLGMAPETTFLAVSKAVAYLAATDSLALASAVLDANELLARESVGIDGIARVCQRLSTVLDTWSVVLGPRGDRLGAYSQTRLPPIRSLLDEIRALQRPDGPTVLPLIGQAGPAIAYLLRQGRRTRGYLLLGRSGTTTALERRVINMAVTLLTLMLSSSPETSDLDIRLRNRYAQDLLDGNLRAAEHLAELIGTTVPSGPLYVAASQSRYPPGDARQESWRLLVDALGSSLVASDAYNELAIVDSTGMDVPASLHPVLAELGDRTVGLAGPAARDKLDMAKRAALLALAQANRTGVSLVDAREMQSGRLLELLPEGQASHFARDLLGPLLDARATARGDLLLTLRTWLAHHGQWDPAAAELGIHRHTLRNRIDRVERILQMPLDSATCRMELWAALELLDR